ncbi:unnamed protein product [Wuchereria bancrofti]|uniref:Uncharacterized protein n=1 Tax=Wuchereria bancrofti TaxID=6293 RepID=A0A3P7DYZ3_WUCBA|nr:unnamed protein product [Wuchereria bancrofti]
MNKFNVAFDERRTVHHRLEIFVESYLRIGTDKQTYVRYCDGREGNKNRSEADQIRVDDVLMVTIVSTMTGNDE